MLIIRSIYFLLVIICIGISLYLTYFGFLLTFHELTLPFTVVIGLVLFAADFLIQKYREAGRSIKWPLVLFLIGAFFSTISNFNFLYTNFMTRDVTAETLRGHYDIFRDDLVKTRARLVSLRAVQDELAKRDLIDTELLNMRQQATDPARPGCGTRCREHMATINSQLTTKPTDLAIPTTVGQFNQFCERYSQIVYESLDAEPDAATYVKVRNIQREIDTALSKYSSPETALQGQGLSVLSDLSDISLEIERRSNELLPAGDKVDHVYIDPGMGRLGEIVYSLQNGFVDRPNLGATILSVIASVIVDILPVIFAIIAFGSGVNLGGSTAGNTRPRGLL